MDRLDTQPKFPPKSAFAEFTVVSKLPPTQLVADVERLFKQDPLLRDALPCSRYGANDANLDCRKVIREDVFAADFRSEAQTLMLSLVPKTRDVDYKPDYEHFNKLRDQIAQVLATHFGKGAVILR